MNLVLKAPIILFMLITTGCGSAGGGVKPAKQSNMVVNESVKVSGDALENRKNRRKTAFANTFQRSQLDVGTPGKGARSLRILKTQAELVDSIHNGSKVAKPLFDNLSSAHKQLLDTHHKAFNSALLLETPLEEIRLKALLDRCSTTKLPSDCRIQTSSK